MNSKFKKGFDKTAGVVGAITRPVAKGAKLVGSGVVNALGGKLGVAGTLFGLASDVGDASKKMERARNGLL